MLQCEINFVFVRRSCRELYVMNGRRTKIKWRCRLVALGKRHCLAKLTLYVHIGHVFDGLYASWRVKATLRYRFKKLYLKQRPQSQSYIGPTPNAICSAMHILFLSIYWSWIWIPKAGPTVWSPLGVQRRCPTSHHRSFGESARFLWFQLQVAVWQKGHDNVEQVWFLQVWTNCVCE